MPFIPKDIDDCEILIGEAEDTVRLAEHHLDDAEARMATLENDTWVLWAWMAANLPGHVLQDDEHGVWRRMWLN